MKWSDCVTALCKLITLGLGIGLISLIKPRDSEDCS